MNNVLSVKDSLLTDVKTSIATQSFDNAGKASKKTLGALAMLSAITPGVFANNAADTFFNNFADILKNIFKAIEKTIHIFAASLLGIALLIRLVSKNQRTIEEANAWMKNIIISWIAFYSLSVLVTLISSFKTDNAANPWDAK